MILSPALLPGRQNSAYSPSKTASPRRDEFQESPFKPHREICEIREKVKDSLVLVFSVFRGFIHLKTVFENCWPARISVPIDCGNRDDVGNRSAKGKVSGPRRQHSSAPFILAAELQDP